MTGLREYTTCCAIRLAERAGLSDEEIRSMLCAELAPHAAPEQTIPAASNRILAVVRTYHALLLNGQAHEDALTCLKQWSGVLLDPVVVGDFLEIVRTDAITALLMPDDDHGRYIAASGT